MTKEVKFIKPEILAAYEQWQTEESFPIRLISESKSRYRTIDNDTLESLRNFFRTLIERNGENAVLDCLHLLSLDIQNFRPNAIRLIEMLSYHLTQIYPNELKQLCHQHMQKKRNNLTYAAYIQQLCRPASQDAGTVYEMAHTILFSGNIADQTLQKFLMAQTLMQDQELSIATVMQHMIQLYTELSVQIKTHPTIKDLDVKKFLIMFIEDGLAELEPDQRKQFILDLLNTIQDQYSKLFAMNDTDALQALYRFIFDPLIFQLLKDDAELHIQGIMIVAQKAALIQQPLVAIMTLLLRISHHVGESEQSGTMLCDYQQFMLNCVSTAQQLFKEFVTQYLATHPDYKNPEHAEEDKKLQKLFIKTDQFRQLRSLFKHFIAAAKPDRLDQYPIEPHLAYHLVAKVQVDELVLFTQWFYNNFFGPRSTFIEEGLVGTNKRRLAIHHISHIQASSDASSQQHETTKTNISETTWKFLSLLRERINLAQKALQISQALRPVASYLTVILSPETALRGWANPAYHRTAILSVALLCAGVPDFTSFGTHLGQLASHPDPHVGIFILERSCNVLEVSNVELDLGTREMALSFFEQFESQTSEGSMSLTSPIESMSPASSTESVSTLPSPIQSISPESSPKPALPGDERAFAWLLRTYLTATHPEVRSMSPASKLSF